MPLPNQEQFIITRTAEVVSGLRHFLVTRENSGDFLEIEIIDDEGMIEKLPVRPIPQDEYPLREDGKQEIPCLTRDLRELKVILPSIDKRTAQLARVAFGEQIEVPDTLPEIF